MQHQGWEQRACRVEAPRHEAKIDHHGLNALILLSRSKGQTSAERNPEQANAGRIDPGLARDMDTASRTASVQRGRFRPIALMAARASPVRSR